METSVKTREETNEALEKTDKKKNRIIYIDILNILACLSVILMHCNGDVHIYSNTHSWSINLIAEVIGYWAVPVFIMITGATLMEYRKKYDTKTFFKKRIEKVVIPFIFWAVAMLVWKMWIGEIRLTTLSVREIINIIMTNKEESVYYFMFVIIGIYLTLPALSVLSEEKYRKILWYIVGVIFVTEGVLPVLFKVIGLEYNPDLNMLFKGYTIYVVLGYLLSKTKLDKKKRYILYALGILSCILRYSVTYYLSTKQGYKEELLFGYVQFHTILLACAVFEFIKNINWDKILKKEAAKNTISKIASCSFGVYLIHKIVMYYEINLLGIQGYKLYILGPILTYAIALVITYILKKIPLVNKIVP